MIKQKVYQEADKVVIINDNDEDLYPIEISLPEPPAPEKIDGYGLDPKDQKFQYQIMPEKLRNIETRIRAKLGAKTEVTLDHIDTELYENEIEYKSEIKWIKQQIKRHYHGYWFYNHGKPTFITGAHYTFLNWWPIGAAQDRKVFEKTGRAGLAQYRDRDRRWYIAVNYAMNTKEAIYKFQVHFSNKGNPDTRYFNTNEAVKKFVKDHPDSAINEGLFLVENDYRTIFGIIYPKHRREGATTRAAFMNWYVTGTLGPNRFGGIQSLTDEHGYEVFYNHISQRHRYLPFFLRLTNDGTSVPKNELVFSIPATRTVGATGTTKLTSHGGMINYKASGERAYDGSKLWFIHHDEIGKVDPKGGININSYVRWRVVMKCLAQGQDIHGFGMCTSTLGEMSKGGGDVMKKMILDSQFDERDDNGRTRSGLMTIFFPAQDGYDGFVDEYGMSVIEDPEEPIRGINGSMIVMGSKTFLNNQRRALELAGDEDGLIALMQDFPMCLKECFMGSAKSSFMPIIDIRKRIADLLLSPHLIKTGRFEWVDGKFGGKVRFVEDERGVDRESMYKVSYLQVPEKRNLKSAVQHPILGDAHMTPSFQTMGHLTLGVDLAQYSSKEVDNKKKSYHAMALFYDLDPSLDKIDGPDPKDESEWVSNKFILTCKTRDLDVYEFCEECLKVCIYYGAMAYPEMNVKDLYLKFKEWGFAGYLKYDVNEFGEYAKKPGYTVSDGAANTTKQDAIAGMERYMRQRCMYENHRDLLEDCKEIDGPEEMTKYDIFAAGCAALRGARSNFVKDIEEQEEFYSNNDPVFETFYV